MSARNFLTQLALAGAVFALGISAASAHFLTLFPQKQVVDQGDSRQLQMPVYFTHPATMGPTMDMQKPVRLSVRLGQKTSDLTEQLISKQFSGKQGWQLDYSIRRPGIYTFFAEQKPYFDPTEQAVLIQYPKTIVSSFSGEGDWQTKVATPVEIMPLTRPFALWTGSSFTGQVLVNGQPAAGVTVEMEHYNAAHDALPSDAWANQEVITNSQGEFTVTLTKSGWWGIAALFETENGFELNGKKYLLEQAGVLWLQAQDH